MRKISISVPEYQDGLEFEWEDHALVKVSGSYNTTTIEANQAGLISLARHILLLAQQEVPNGSHFHLDEYNFLEEGSVELIISKNEQLG